MIVESQIRPVDPSGNVYLDSLTFPAAYVAGTQITYVFQGKAGDGPNGGSTWATNGARSAFRQALAGWSAVANVSFVEAAGPYNGVGNTAAYDWIEAFEDLPDDDVIGQHELPHTGVMAGSYDSASDYFTNGPLVAGSLAYSTFVHEIGHGLGLLHPHNDEDEPPGDPAFPGVQTPIDGGDYLLNQGVYTVMTYNPGYGEVGYSESDNFGWEGGPMAFDVAAVQRLYGANTATNNGATVYVLPQLNAVGTFWSCIWDAGGNDTLSAGSTNSAAIIDLRAATLQREAGGGGFVSRIAGVLGGFTIANGAVIENAAGGFGDDRIHGNAVSNRLDGGAGYDTVDYSGVTADLVIDLAAGTATGDGADTLVSIEAATGGFGDDRLVAFDGAPGATGVFDVFKRPLQNLANRSLALDLDYAFANRSADPTVATAPGLVTARVHARNGNGSDFYSFFSETSGPIYIDIDNSFALDTVITVYDEAGTEIASNDDGASLDPGSANPVDSFLLIQNAPAGQRLFVEIVDYDRVTGLGFGTSYDLNISLASSRIAEARRLGSILDGGEGDDTFVNGRGDDWLYGGNGSDTAVFSAASTAYTITGAAHEDLTIESAAEGRDRLVDIERFRFSDGNFLWSPVFGLTREDTFPVIQPIAPVTTAEDTPIQITVVATDEDGDTLTYLPGNAAFGTLTGGENGVFTFTPAPDFNGQATFNVHVNDSDARGVHETLSVTVTPVPDAPRFATPTWTVDSYTGEETFIAVDVYDPDEDVLTISAGTPAHGTLAETAIGNFIYTSQPGYQGPDTFTITARDPSGATAQQVVKVNVVTSDMPDWVLYAADGFTGEIGGTGQVFGTTAHEAITVLDRPGTVVFDGTFNRGGDIVHLTGNASGWNVRLSGSNAVFSDGDTDVFIPVGTSGLSVDFDDGARWLHYDQVQTQVKLGSQAVGEEHAPITALPGGPPGPPINAVPGAKAFLYMVEGGEVVVGGQLVEIFGTSGSEAIELTEGVMAFDGTFNRGGDTLALPFAPGLFAGRLSGAQLVLDSAVLDLHIPVGKDGMPISFDGTQGLLRYDADLEQVLLDTQQITATATPLTFG